MGHLERELLNLHHVKPTLWLRYIDDILCIYQGSNINDIFCIYQGSKAEAQNFLLFLNSYHNTIMFTTDISTSTVNLLDVTMKVNETGHLTTTLYRKPTDTYRYLHYKSYHPKHQKKAIPYSQFVRVPQVCSHKSDFFTSTDEMIRVMIAREYPMKLLITGRHKAGQIDRSTLLNPSTTPTTDKNIPLIVTFDPRHQTISSNINNSRFLLDNVKPPFNAKVILTFRRNQNLKNHLVKSKLSRQPQKRSMTPSGKSRCKTCPQIRNTHTVTSTTNSFNYASWPPPPAS